MFICNLSVLMGKKKVKISDVARETGLHRNTISLLYKEEAHRIELSAIEKICRYFECDICDLFELVPDQEEVDKNGED